MKKIILLLLLLAMLLTACSQPPEPSVPTTPPTTKPAPTEPTLPHIDSVESGGVKLTNVGSFQHTGNLMFAYGDFLLLYDQNRTDAPYQMLSPLGESKLTGNYNAATYVGEGVALVSQPGEDYDPVGLVNYRTGEVLAPCEAVKAVCLSQRYCMLVYAQSAVQAEEEAFSSYKNKNGETVYYAGYATVLDITTGALVPELKLEIMPSDAGGWGDRFYIRNDKVTVVYNADGTVALSMEDAQILGDIAMYNTIGGVHIYNSQLELLAQLKHASQRLTLIPGGYLRFYEGGVFYLLDLQGNPVVEDMYQDITCVIGNYIVARKENGWGITALTGEEVLPYNYLRIKDLGDGKLSLLDTEGKTSILNPDGTVVDADTLQGSGWYYYTETEAGRAYLLQNGQTAHFSGAFEELEHGILGNGEALYELHSGGKLLSGYDRYAYCDGYIYARFRGVWTVFQVELTQ